MLVEHPKESNPHHHCSENFKVFLVHTMQAYKGTRSIAPFINLAVDRGEWLTVHPSCSTPGKDPSTHWIGGWVDHRAGLDATKNRKISCHYGDLNRGQSSSSQNLLSYINFVHWALCPNLAAFGADDTLISLSLLLT